MSKSEQLFEQARAVIPGGVNSPVRAFAAVGGTPPFIDHAEGAYLIDVDGNRYIDYVGSWGPMITGHAHPEIIAAVSQVVEKGGYCNIFVVTERREGRGASTFRSLYGTARAARRRPSGRSSSRSRSCRERSIGCGRRHSGSSS